MIAFGLDVGARQAVEADRIADGAEHHVLELLGGVLDQVDPAQQLDPREGGVGGQRLARLRRQRDLRGHAAIPGAAGAPDREQAVVAPRRFGQDPLVELGCARAPELFARARSPVEGGQPVGAGAAKLGQARPAAQGALRIALAVGQPAEPPERRRGGLAGGMVGNHRAIDGDRVALTREVLEHAALQEQRLRLLRLGARRHDRLERGEGAVPLAGAHVQPRQLEPQRRTAFGRRAVDEQPERARCELLAVQPSGRVGNHAQRARRHRPHAHFVDQALGLAHRDVGHVGPQQALGAVGALLRGQRRQPHALRLQGDDPVAGAVGVGAGRRQQPHLLIRLRRRVELAERLGGEPEQVERAGPLGRVLIRVDQASQHRLGRRVLARAQVQRGGEQQRAWRQPTGGIAIGDAQRGRARARDVALALERVGQQVAHVIADHALLRHIGAELTQERPDVALLIGLHRLRPGSLPFRRGRGRRLARDRDSRHQRHREDQRAEDRRVARGAPGEGDALDAGEVGENGQDPQRGLQQVEEGTGDQADHAFGALHDAHRAADADRLGARLRVAHHHRSDQPGHGHHGAPRVRHLREQDDDTEQDDEVRVPVDDRVEERAERRHLPRRARQRAVEEVAETGQDEEPAGAARAAGDERAGGQQAHAEPQDGEMVRPQVQALVEHPPDRVDPATHGRAVAAEHRQIGCISACSSASRTRASAAGSSIFRPRPSCT